jgi:transposase-like protein
MKVKKTSLKQHRIFSEEVRKQVVRDIERGKCTVIEASRELQVSGPAIYRWLYKYSLYLQKQRLLVVENKSEAMRSKELLKRITELEAALGRKQMEVDLLNKVLELASKEYKLDLKKNILNQLSNGTEDTKE